MRHPISPS